MTAAAQTGKLLRIGLTGGIGSGKSTVAALLRDCGAAVIDSDALAHALTAPGGAALPAIAARFGSDVIGHDGAMDRARMREKVFADPAARQALEGILHPMIAQATQRAAEAVPEGQPIVFDVPLLVESRQWPGRVQRVLVVDCRETTQVARVMARSGWTAEAVQQVLAQQASRQARRAAADAVLFNDDLPLDGLRTQVQQLWTWWFGDPHRP